MFTAHKTFLSQGTFNYDVMITSLFFYMHSQIIHAILRLLDPLCKLPEFGARLYSSALFVNLYKVPKTATVVSSIYSVCY